MEGTKLISKRTDMVKQLRKKCKLYMLPTRNTYKTQGFWKVQSKRMKRDILGKQ